MRVYLHTPGAIDPQALDVDGDAVISAALSTAEGAYVLLEDTDDALDATQTFTGADIPDRAHLYVGPRPRILALVRFNGPTIDREFSASARVEQIFRWATGEQGFDLSPADAAEHVLQLPDGTFPPPDAQLGTLPETAPGRVSFDLVPKHRYEG